MDTAGSTPVEGTPCAYLALSKAHPALVRLAQFKGYAKIFGWRAAILRTLRVVGLARRTPGGLPSLSVVPPSEEEVLGLEPSEWVVVRSADEIRATLDARGCFRGLYFMDEMWNYCGRRFQVLKRMDRLMVESTGQMRRIKNTVLLSGTTCDGSAHRGCDASCHHLWREIWLRRVANEQALELLPEQEAEQHYA